jgi:SAM-dependent methyltransferase
MAPDNPWLSGPPDRGSDYAARVERLAATGKYMHGEADLVCSLLSPQGATVLDAGCGTGRVAIELARRGATVTGVDLDPAMLAEARAEAPSLEWIAADLADPTLDLGRRFDVVVAAGNVMIFLTPGTESLAVQTMARHLQPGGWLVAGFHLARPGANALSLDRYDRYCSQAGLVLVERWSTWESGAWSPEDDYAVSVHQPADRPAGQPAAGPSTRSV